MNRTALTAAALATTLLCVGTPLAQTSVTSGRTSTGRETHLITPEDVLSIRDLRELQISPDGKQVAFKVTEPADPKLPRAPRTSNIWIVPADGSEPPRPWIPNLKNATSPRWSPDGKMIAFIARDQPTAKEQERQAAGDDATEVDRNFKYSRLWVANLSDRKAVQVTKQDFEINELAWSPQGDEIALVVARTQKPEDSLLLSLLVVNRSTGEVARTLSTNVELTGGLRWSPDGRWITFYEGPPTKDFSAWVAVVAAGEGGPVRPLMKDYPGSLLMQVAVVSVRHQPIRKPRC